MHNHDLVPIVFLLMVPLTAIGVPIARAIARRLERGATERVPSDVAARLERMEQAIDSIAIEIERISEGQRFTTKLLADRALPGSQSVDARREPARASRDVAAREGAQ